MLLPALNNAKLIARDVACKNNQKQLGLLLTGYANDYNGWVLQNNTAEHFITFLTTQTGTKMLWNQPQSLKGFHCPASEMDLNITSVAYLNWVLYGSYINTVASSWAVKAPGYGSPYGVYFQNLFKSDFMPSKHFFISDAALPVWNGKVRSSDYFYTYDKGSGDWGYVHLLHKNKTNIWFADGHIGAVTSKDLKPVYNIRTARILNGTQRNL